jgi:hydrogenase expression/formation protein HypE
VGAGSMIMAVKAGLEEKLIAHLHHKNIPANVIGEFTPKENGFVIVEDEKDSLFQFDGHDPYWGAFFKALNAGWT